MIVTCAPAATSRRAVASPSPDAPPVMKCTLSADLHLMFSFERRRATYIDGTQYQPTWFLVSPRPGELHRERAYDTAWIDGRIPLIVVGQDGRMSIPSTSVDVPGGFASSPAAPRSHRSGSMGSGG